MRIFKSCQPHVKKTFMYVQTGIRKRRFVTRKLGCCWDDDITKKKGGNDHRLNALFQIVRLGDLI
jgi:hypothetical protein